METTTIMDALAALAQESRLKIYRLLVEAGPDGLAAGRIGEDLKLPPATLSFHLAHLARARLVRARQQGRFIYYSAEFGNMSALVAYLTDNCCAMSGCAPAACRPSGKAATKPAASMKASTTASKAGTQPRRRPAADKAR